MPSDAYLNLSPDIAYLAGNQDAWPDIKDRPFRIYTERIEDQLDAEAEAASPLYYDDNDKENEVLNPELEPMPNPLGGISIMPAPRYRQSHRLYTLSGHDPMVSNALYAHPQFEASPYGLGWSDGARDIENNALDDCPVPEYLRILASGENLPQSSSQEGKTSDGHDSVLVSSSQTMSIGALELLR
jgi:hypothetical protein